MTTFVTERNDSAEAEQPGLAAEYFAGQKGLPDG